MDAIGIRLNEAAAALIKRRRQALGLSQEQLASACDLDRTYVSAIERGKRNISLGALGRILTALQLDASSFARELL